MEKTNNPLEVRPENKGVYELNCKLAEALNLTHKKELDCKDHFYTHGGRWERWDQRSINVRLHRNDRLREIDFTRRLDVLVTYCNIYGINLLFGEETPTAVLTKTGSDTAVELTGVSIADIMIKAILRHCELTKPDYPQTLVSDFKEITSKIE